MTKLYGSGEEKNSYTNLDFWVKNIKNNSSYKNNLQSSLGVLIIEVMGSLSFSENSR